MIDRKKLVTKHNPKLRKADLYSPLSAGNGDFVFTADITGLQSFNQDYDKGMPLCTMSNWGWHTTPVSETLHRYTKSDLEPKYYDTYGRQVPYYTGREDREKYDAIRQNPHKYNLGRVGFVFLDEKDKPAALSQIANIRQELNLYDGILTSCYDVFEHPCRVRTVCDSESDSIAVEAESGLIGLKRMYAEIEFPYPSWEMNGSDWNSKARHTSELVSLDDRSWVIIRIIDKQSYSVFITGEDTLDVAMTEAHRFKITAAPESARLSFNVSFMEKLNHEMLKSGISNRKIIENSKAAWKAYWENGGMVSFSKSVQPAAQELERRVILSQYLTAIQCGGRLPPAETGLTCNSWYGKFHLEMHFWHAAHFVLFSRMSKLEASLKWYKDILPEAKGLAQSQGYEGARWPKMVAPDGVDSPSPIGPLLIWQQPHVILYCDWCYRARKDRRILEAYSELVFETANFMASYAVYDSQKDRYVLGPPVIPAQERHNAQTTLNPAFELEYWLYGLKTASRWLKELGREIPQKWTDIIHKLALPTICENTYMAQENCPETFEKVNNDHPSMLGAYGMLASERIDRKVMSHTLDRVLKEWQFDTLWGWDFSIMAMTAARLGRKRDAVDILLKETPKNVYLVNGHNRQVLRSDLPLYLPGNGGLLLAVAMMLQFDAFPDDDGWAVEFEGMNGLM